MIKILILEHVNNFPDLGGIVSICDAELFFQKLQKSLLIADTIREVTYDE